MPLETIEQARARLDRGQESSLGLLQAALARAGDAAGQGRTVFTRLYTDRARAAADAADRRRASGQRLSPIDGLPVSIKDLFDVAGEPTTAGAMALRDEPAATRDATIVARLRDAGAVIVGKTNMTEFALGALGLNPTLGTPLAPWRREEGRIAGGSSSGAAVSVTDGMALAAIGTDTGGSVRIPAAFCNLVGFKPTAARVDRTGAFALSTSLDSIGPLVHTVADCRIVDRILSDERHVAAACDPRALRIGVPGDYVLDSCDDTVLQAFEATLDRLRQAGVTVVRLPMPVLSRIPEINGAGGFSPIEGLASHRDVIDRLHAAMDPRIASRFLAARQVPDAVYQQIRELRAKLIEIAAATTATVDAVAMPTVAILPPREAELVADEAYFEINRLAVRNPQVANMLDRCAITIPCAGALPVGFSLMGENGGDARLFDIATALEGAIRG